MGEQPSGAAHAGLHLVEHQKDAELVGDFAQALEVIVARGGEPALALHRLDDNAGRLRPDHRPHLVEIAVGDMIETRRRRPEALEVFLVAGGGERRQRAAVERAGAANQPHALGMAGLGVVFARDLDRGFHRLGARVAEEGGVGEGNGGEALGGTILSGDLVQVGGVPQLPRLGDQRLDQMRMGVAEHRHGDAAGEIEEFPAVGGEEIGAVAPLERQIGPSIGRQNC